MYLSSCIPLVYLWSQSLCTCLAAYFHLLPLSNDGFNFATTATLNASFSTKVVGLILPNLSTDVFLTFYYYHCSLDRLPLSLSLTLSNSVSLSLSLFMCFSSTNHVSSFDWDIRNNKFCAQTFGLIKQFDSTLFSPSFDAGRNVFCSQAQSSFS